MVVKKKSQDSINMLNYNPHLITAKKKKNTKTERVPELKTLSNFTPSLVVGRLSMQNLKSNQYTNNNLTVQ